MSLSSEPSLGSMVITSGGVWKYSYIPPKGTIFPVDTESHVLITDRAGATLGVLDGVLGEDFDRINFSVSPGELAFVPQGANWELFVVLDGDTYKVRYGRVVRREPSYPLVSTLDYDPFEQAIYEDPLDRSSVGPRWIDKLGKTSMYHNGSPPPAYLMAVRSKSGLFGGLTLYNNSAVQWYAPTKTDTIEVTVKLWADGIGKTTVAFCSNYAMTNFLGVMFDSILGSGDQVRIVTGSGPISLTIQASLGRIVGNNDLYTMRYTLSTNKVELWVGAATGTAPLSWTDTTHLVTHGAGHRYTGLSWQGGLTSTGPQLAYFKISDV